MTHNKNIIIQLPQVIVKYFEEKQNTVNENLLNADNIDNIATILNTYFYNVTLIL